MNAPIAMHTENSGCHFKVVIIGDGFDSSQADKDKFDVYAEKAYQSIKTQDPFSNNLSKINFYKVPEVSTNSGIPTSSAGAGSGTYWETHTSGSSRVAGQTCTGRQKVEDEIGGFSGGNTVFVVLLMNKDAHVGVGEYHDWKPCTANYPNTMQCIAACHSTQNTFDLLVRHEFAHTFSDLDDEYFGEKPNCTFDPSDPHACDDTWNWFNTWAPSFLQIPNRANTKDTDPGGWFLGSRYSSIGKYRSSDNDIMRGKRVNGLYPVEYSADNKTHVTARINAEAITCAATLVINTTGYSWPSSQACKKVPNVTKYHSGVSGKLHQGHVLYNDVNLTIPFNGGGKFYKTEDNGVLVEIMSNGTMGIASFC